jgi:hypothetical protein
MDVEVGADMNANYCDAPIACDDAATPHAAIGHA